MRYLRPLAATAVSVLVACGQTSPETTLAPLPAGRAFPLSGEQCGCLTFRRGNALTDTNVLLSSTPKLGRVRLGKKDHELPHTSLRRNGRAYQNKFSGNGITVSLSSEETSFARECGSYGDPPPHGSCYVGTVELQASSGSSTVPVTSLCGC